MPLELNKLQVLLEVARGGSYAAAAGRLHVTPSAVSHAMRRLEAGAGRRLLERRGRRLALTDEGAYLHGVCERVFAQLDEAEQRLAGKGAGVEMHLVLGATVEFGSTVLIRMMRPLLEAHPELRVDFRFSHELTRPLLQDEIDMAVDCRPHVHPAVESLSLFREQYVVVAAPGFLARHPVLTPLDLEPLPVLSLDKEARWWDNMLQAVPRRQRPVFRRIVTVNHIRGLINATLEGLGVSLAPKYAVHDELARGRLKILFPRLRLLEDRFCIYQKRSRAGREKNLLMTRYLMDLRQGGAGDAIWC